MMDARNVAREFEALVAGGAGDGPHARARTVGPEILGEGDLVIRVHWSSVNYKDALAMSPTGKVARITPLIPGIDLAGEVVSCESGAFTPGDQVVAHGYDLGVAHHGGYATYARLPSAWAFPLPAGLTARDAMAIGTAGFTAALSVVQLEHHGLRPGAGPVLVTGATGGVGSAAVSILAGLGYEVVASTGKADRADWLRGLGAAEVTDRVGRAEPFRPLAKERWAGVVDSVGGQALAQILANIRYGGAVAASGLTGGAAFDGAVFPFILRGVALLGIDSVQCEMGRRTEVWNRLGADLKPREIDALVAGEVRLAGVEAATAAVLAGAMAGRTLVDLR